jgi:hypothetical protein
VRERTEPLLGLWHPDVFQREDNMSKTTRYAWRDQQAILNERMKGFLQNPGTEDAAKSGAIEIPQQFTTYI